ncbi:MULTISPECIES: Ig-like domain repeat protein [unclassified Streptomyces]|uniref:WD40 repeat domain-containing protein n=1 Tax=unclassified Streptomyces TaxID=2593676 RepID=UPI000DBA74B9|nr:Ig-like domain repeat protein [Streptomyces sp. PsTaAH-137]MYT70053.1 Ig-like domain repeat protein [Streptomyces sp. SID8367]RAJ88626.1 DNA-binding beta-propeller fold protein YncE [Streptomyces sp. PsTaAH-137]
MRRRALSTATALAVLAGSAALSVAVSGTAVADSAKSLGVRTVADIAVDGVHKRVYLSAPQDNAIVVTDYSGTEVQRITGLDGVQGLALSADSGRLYAAVQNTDKIAAIDTADTTKVTSYDLGGADAPEDLAVAGSTVWFSYGAAAEGSIGSLDPTQETPAVSLGQSGQSFYGAPVLAVSADGSELAAAEKDTSGGSVAIYDLNGTAATQRVVKGLDGSFYDQLAFSPDGSQLVTASGAPYEHPAYSTTDLSKVHTYPSGDYGAGVAISPSGTVAAGTSSWYGDDLHIYRQGGTEAIRTYEFGNTSTSSGGDTLIDGVMSWSPDGSTLFAVSDNSEGNIRFHSYTDPNRTTPTLTVNAPSTATRAKALTVSGKISSAVPFSTPAKLTVTKTDLDNPNGKVLTTVTAKADGTYSFGDTPAVGGKVTYKVAYAGDADHAAVTKSDSVEVSRSSTSLTLNKNKNVYEYGSDVTFTAHLGTTYKNRTVAIYANPYGSDKPNKLVKSGKVNSSGNLSVTLDLTRDVTLSAVFTGDARYKPKTVTNTVYTRARSSVTLSNYYKSGTIGSHKYYYFHKNSTVYETTSMNYYKGRKFRLDLQIYGNGSWHSADSEYIKLGTSGKTKVNMGAVGAAGYKFRLRAVYVNGSSGDNVNTGKYSSWKYLYSTN